MLKDPDKETDVPSPSHLSTKGNYSPGIVMGNYTVSAALTPTSVTLEEAFKLSLEFRPSHKGYFIDLEKGHNVFVNGCKFDMHIGNAGTCDLVLKEFRLSVEVEDVERPTLKDKERAYGALFVAHQLFIDLYRNTAPGWWLLSEGTKHGQPRRFADAREDILASAEDPRLQFRLTPGELEVIEGGITPREDGLFRVRFVFGLATATEKLRRTTADILIIKGDMEHGS